MPLNIAELAGDGNLRCPQCKTELTVGLTPISGKIYAAHIQASQSQQNIQLRMLQDALLGYFRWCAEGRKTHGEGGQYYHDSYHSHIEYLRAEDAYTFSIQTSDSPDGDIWWHGKFKLWGRGEIKEVYDESMSSF